MTQQHLKDGRIAVGSNEQIGLRNAILGGAKPKLRSESIKDQDSNIEQFVLDQRHSMFEPWKRFDARKAAALMNKHRKALRQEHASLRKLLRDKSKDQKAEDMSERINALRQTWRQALVDHISVCRALSDGIFLVNLNNYLDACLAQGRLFATCNEVERTLQQFGPTPKSN
jgi:acyl-CoA reductase-like NAD-dependent aldehyde dehydrogenase